MKGRPMRVVIAALLSLACTAAPALATELGNVASSMPARSWATVSTVNAGIVSQYYTSLGPDRGGRLGRQRGGVEQQEAAALSDGGHGPRQAPGTGRHVHLHRYARTPGRRGRPRRWTPCTFTITSRGTTPTRCSTSELAATTTTGSCATASTTRRRGAPARRERGRSMPNTPSGCFQVANALVYYPTMDGGSLLCWDGDGGMSQFRESTGSWTTIAGLSGPPSGHLVVPHVHGVQPDPRRGDLRVSERHLQDHAFKGDDAAGGPALLARCWRDQ